jgi:hypothetical protein
MQSILEILAEYLDDSMDNFEDPIEKISIINTINRKINSDTDLQCLLLSSMNTENNFTFINDCDNVIIAISDDGSLKTRWGLVYKILDDFEFPEITDTDSYMSELKNCFDEYVKDNFVINSKS